MGLIREHAELFVNDKVINEIFEAYCSPSNACYSGKTLSLSDSVYSVLFVFMPLHHLCTRMYITDVLNSIH